jgi:uncharacterized membrane protein
MKTAAHRYLLLPLVLSLLPHFAFALGDIVEQFTKVVLYGLILIVVLLVVGAGALFKKK